MLKNAPTLAIVAVHTEENEPLQIWGDLFNLIQFGPYSQPHASTPVHPHTRSCTRIDLSTPRLSSFGEKQFSFKKEEKRKNSQ